MSAGRICTREVQLLSAQATTETAARQMARWNVGSLVVLGPDERPVGVVTDRDLALRVMGEGRDPAGTPVIEVMTPWPETIDEDAPIERAIERMRALGLRRLPVVRDDGHLVGILTLDDVLGLLAEEMEQVGALVDATGPTRWPPRPVVARA